MNHNRVELLLDQYDNVIHTRIEPFGGEIAMGHYYHGTGTKHITHRVFLNRHVAVG
jgi:hypothetical protein